MPNYRVCLTQERSHSCVVEIEAQDANAARDLALMRYHKNPGKFEFEDDCNFAETDVSWIENEKGETE